MGTFSAVINAWRLQRASECPVPRGDKCWINGYMLERKEQSKEWLLVGSQPPKKFKSEHTGENVFATVFWDAKDVLLIKFQPRRVSQTSIHALDIMWKLRYMIQNKYNEKLSEKILFWPSGRKKNRKPNFWTPLPFWCNTGCSFDVQIVKIEWYIHWPRKTGEFEDGTCWTSRSLSRGTVIF